VIREVAAKRYAEAAYLIAREVGKEEEWSSGLRALAALFSDEQARALLENPRISLGEKFRIVEKALEDVEPQVLNLARLLLRRGRGSLAPQIQQAYQQILDEARGLFHAVVTTAVPLSRDDLKAVERRLREISGGDVVLETHVDESILGGLIVRIGDRLIDGSTRSKLLALRNQLAGARS
jgi:F-type H+-transporting ATPase subunit delta